MKLLLISALFAACLSAQDHVSVMSGLAGPNNISYRIGLLVQADAHKTIGGWALESRSTWSNARKVYAVTGYTAGSTLTLYRNFGPWAIGPSVSYGHLSSTEFKKDSVQFGAGGRYRGNGWSPFVSVKGPEVGTLNRATSLTAGVDVFLPLGQRWGVKGTMSHSFVRFRQDGGIRYGHTMDLRAGPYWSF